MRASDSSTGTSASDESASGRTPANPLGRLNVLLGEIYEMAIDATHIQGVANEMTWLAGADNGGIAITRNGTSELVLLVYSPRSMFDERQLLDVYTAMEPWRRALLQKEAGRMHLDTEVALQPEVLDEPGFQRWLEVSGNRWRTSGYLPLGNDLTAFFGFARRAGKRPFQREDVRPLESVLQHFARASRINRVVNELTVMHDVAEERYGRLGVGIVLLNSTRQATYLSRAARRILALDLGLQLRDRELCCASAADQAVLDRAIATQLQLANRQGVLGGETVTLGGVRGTVAPLTLIISPYQNRLETHTLITTSGRVLILVFDPAFQAPSREQALRELYGLSLNEAELALALADGQRLDTIARAEGVSKETLRSRLKRVFAKTGTHGQPELLRLLLASPALLEHRSAPARGRRQTDAP